MVLEEKKLSDDAENNNAFISVGSEQCDTGTKTTRKN